LEKIPIPEPKPNEVLISVKSVGICGSDVHYYTHGRIGDFIVNSPMILGHESSGVIVKLGSEVKNFKEGDRITMEPGVPCRMCHYCKKGSYNLCPDVRFMATPPIHGALANFITHPADFCYKLPDHVSFEEGAMCEPLSVGVHACKRAGITLGSRVLITGAGPIGLMCLLAAKAAGASSVVISDIKEDRLEVAKKLGGFPINSKLDVREEIQRFELGPITATIECSGAETAIKSAIRSTASGGIVVLVGLGPPEIKLPIVDAAVREVDIRGVFRYANSYPAALDLIASKKVDVKPLMTHRYDLQDSLKAFHTARDMTDGAIKVMINL